MDFHGKFLRVRLVTEDQQNHTHNRGTGFLRHSYLVLINNNNKLLNFIKEIKLSNHTTDANNLIN